MKIAEPLTATERESAGGIPAFLTAYDPSDLPGTSIDPLGFERGYLFLADKILPGLTNVGRFPRYFSLLCTGSYLAKSDSALPTRQQHDERRDCVLRFERFWALANVLASRSSNGKLRTDGIRGVLYVEPHADKLLRKGTRQVDANFKVLIRQVPYGAIGIYGAVAHEMRLWDRKTLALSPDLGEQLAEGFMEVTDLPRSLQRAVVLDGSISLRILEKWGSRAHISTEPGPTEQRCFRELIMQNDVRYRMAKMLAKHLRKPGESELQRLARIGRSLRNDTANTDLREAINTILAYEESYRWALLGFERLLWLCREQSGGTIKPDRIQKDEVLMRVAANLAEPAIRLGRILDDADSENFRTNLAQLDDVRAFLESASAVASDPVEVCREILSRHSDVQRGKLDRGRRKMPWLEENKGQIRLSVTRIGGLRFEATDPQQIAPHPYRLTSADSLIRAAKFNPLTA